MLKCRFQNLTVWIIFVVVTGLGWKVYCFFQICSLCVDFFQFIYWLIVWNRVFTDSFRFSLYPFCKWKQGHHWCKELAYRCFLALFIKHVTLALQVIRSPIPPAHSVYPLHIEMYTARHKRNLWGGLCSSIWNLTESYQESQREK